MRISSIILVMFCLCTMMHAQRKTLKNIATLEVTKPSVSEQGDWGLKIMNVTITEKKTQIDFLYKTNNSSITMIPEQPHNYLQIVADDGQIYKGIASSAQKYRGYVQPGREQWFAVVFEKMPFDVISFDLLETEKGIPGMYHLPKWNCIDVRLKTDAQIKSEINGLIKDANGGSSDAAYDLGLIYEQGKMVQKDIDLSFQYYLKSAELGDVDAKEKIALAYFFDTNKLVTEDVAFAYLLDAGNADLPMSQYILGSMYENSDIDKARDWMQKSAKNGSPYAQFWVAQKFADDKNYESAFYWYEVSAKQGHRQAQNELGDLYYYGRGTTQSYENAFSWFQVSAQNDYPSAKSNLAHMFQFGYGTSQNYRKAIELYEELIGSTDDTSLQSRTFNSLGNIYSQVGEYINYQKAIDYYQKAIALNNNIYSLYSVGKMYNDGKGVLRNPTKGKEFMEKSALAGYGLAQYDLAVVYQKANVLKAAFKWFDKSAEGGYAPAQYELGLMYYYGKGVVKNNKLAAKWIENAYNAGNVDAQKVWNGLELWKYK